MLLFVDNSRFINDSHYEFRKIFFAHISLVKMNKNVTAQIFLELCTLNPG